MPYSTKPEKLFGLFVRDQCEPLMVAACERVLEEVPDRHTGQFSGEDVRIAPVRWGVDGRWVWDHPFEDEEL